MLASRKQLPLFRPQAVTKDKSDPVIQIIICSAILKSLEYMKVCHAIDMHIGLCKIALGGNTQVYTVDSG